MSEWPFRTRRGTKLRPLSYRYVKAVECAPGHIGPRHTPCRPPGCATMKTFRALPLLALLALASGSALASSPTDVTRYDCKLPESSRPAGGARTVVTASPELVKSVVLDFEHYAHYFDPDKGKNPDKKWASHVVGKSGDKT